MLRAVLRGVLTGALRAPDVAPPVATFSPAQLFANGEQGGWWDASDFSTMFQDSAGTTPVTAVGQPVGKILDKSGRGNHRAQATAANRPTLQQDGGGFFYLGYDGVNDSMATPSVDFSATNKVTVWAGISKQSDAVIGIVAELTANSTTTAGSFGLLAPGNAAAANYNFRSGGTTPGVGVIPATFTAPISNVLCGIADIAAPSVALRVNGVLGTAANTAAQGTGNYSNAPIFFGSRGGATLPFNGREYQTIIRGAASTAAQIAQAERFVGSKMGIAL